ncbi:MAG: VTT domain-containing protein, partial [Planctomycetes bacterium]|nr:VTT domain-containing protein [Planctomycetota bacterium]
PIPSSIVSTACGLLLGATMGTAVSLLGMTISCLLGYWLGRGCGRTLAVRLVSLNDLDRFQSVHARFEDWAVVISRPIPVLAEVSVLFAGLSCMPAPRFFLLSALANMGVSLGYALVGAYASSANAFFVAFAGALLLPGLFMLVARTQLISRLNPPKKIGATP